MTRFAFGVALVGVLLWLIAHANEERALRQRLTGRVLNLELRVHARRGDRDVS
jgi:hypothetical protein